LSAMMPAPASISIAIRKIREQFLKSSLSGARFHQVIALPDAKFGSIGIKVFLSLMRMKFAVGLIKMSCER
jgi:hypothetical protein